MIDREKVLRALEHCDICSDRPNCPGCDYLREPDCVEHLKRDIIALLKAQEPVKPVVDIDTWKCGNCGHALEHQQLLGDNVLLHEQYNYCPECGRAVKWE